MKLNRGVICSLWSVSASNFVENVWVTYLFDLSDFVWPCLTLSDLVWLCLTCVVMAMETEPEFHDLPEEQNFDTPMSLTAEKLGHVVIAWGAEQQYDGDFSALRFKFFLSLCVLKLGNPKLSYMQGCFLIFGANQGTKRGTRQCPGFWRADILTTCTCRLTFVKCGRMTPVSLQETSLSAPGLMSVLFYMTIITVLGPFEFSYKFWI